VMRGSLQLNNATGTIDVGRLLPSVYTIRITFGTKFSRVNKFVKIR